MKGSGAIADRLHIVAAVNDEDVLDNNLKRSDMVASGRVALSCYRGAKSAAQAYNEGLDDTSAEIIVFAHQDVFFPDAWEAELERAITLIEAEDPNWAVIGAWGIDTDGEFQGHAWSSGLSRRLGGRFERPREIECIDEFVIIVRRASGLRFDETLPGFHLYAADIVLAARQAGLKSYVADIPAIHNSKPVPSYSGGYSDAWLFMRKKWRDVLPIRTLTVPLSRSLWPLFRARLRLWRSRRMRFENANDPKTDPRELARHLEP